MSENSEQDVAFIRALAEMLHKTDLTEIEVKREYGEADQLKVRLSRAVAAAPAPTPMASNPVQVAPSPAPAAEAAPQNTAKPAADEGPDLSKALTSPMVGTVYLAAEPDSDPFVSVGDTVTEGQTVLIIEAMKTMNQIPAQRSGKVTRVLVQNAEPVEFGAPLMIIE